MAIDVGAVEYVTTADGVSIAYQAVGSGPRVIRLPTESISLRFLSERFQGQSSSDAALAEVLTVVSYDPRGIGMSDRTPRDFSLDASVADAVAVAEALGAPLTVFASQLQVPTALRLAGERPDLVSQLLLMHAFAADNLGIAGTPLVQASDALLEADWETYKQFLARVIGRMEGSMADAYVDQLEEEIGEDALKQQLAELYGHDASQWVTSLAVPTLFVEAPARPHRQAFSGSRALSRQIPDARLVRSRDTAHMVGLVRQFVAPTQDEARHGAFRTVMFTDLVSSTALTQRVGDHAAQATVETHDAAVRRALAGHQGVEIKHTGDGIMAAFDSATDAANAAHQIVLELVDQGVQVRVGLNAGEPIERDGDLFGTAVQLAARVCDAAGDSQVLATSVVRDLTAGKGLNWLPATPIEAKGFEEPTSVHSLSLG